MTDWNVFYSSLSQSAAGLISIIAAFIISKILNENEKLENLSDKYHELLIEYEKLTQQISIRHFDWYDRLVIEYSSRIQDAIENGDFANLNNEQKLEKLFQIEPRLFGTENCLSELEKQITKYTIKMTKLPNGVSNRSHIPVLDIVPVGTWDRLNEEKENINQLNIESKVLISKFIKFKSDLSSTQRNLAPLKNTIYILGFSFFFTVVYPLHFLPIPENSTPAISFSVCNFIKQTICLKGFFLLMLVLVVVGIFGYFSHIIHNLQTQFDKIKIEGKHINLKEYSKYFN